MGRQAAVGRVSSLAKTRLLPPLNLPLTSLSLQNVDATPRALGYHLLRLFVPSSRSFFHSILSPSALETDASLILSSNSQTSGLKRILPPA